MYKYLVALMLIGELFNFKWKKIICEINEIKDNDEERKKFGKKHAFEILSMFGFTIISIIIIVIGIANESIQAYTYFLLIFIQVPLPTRIKGHLVYRLIDLIISVGVLTWWIWSI